jgi:hypothetical protein
MSVRTLMGGNKSFMLGLLLLSSHVWCISDVVDELTSHAIGAESGGGELLAKLCLI